MVAPDNAALAQKVAALELAVQGLQDWRAKFETPPSQCRPLLRQRPVNIVARCESSWDDEVDLTAMYEAYFEEKRT